MKRKKLGSGDYSGVQCPAAAVPKWKFWLEEMLPGRTRPEPQAAETGTAVVHRPKEVKMKAIHNYFGLTRIGLRSLLLALSASIAIPVAAQGPASPPLPGTTQKDCSDSSPNGWMYIHVDFRTAYPQPLSRGRNTGWGWARQHHTRLPINSWS